MFLRLRRLLKCLRYGFPSGFAVLLPLTISYAMLSIAVSQTISPSFGPAVKPNLVDVLANVRNAIGYEQFEKHVKGVLIEQSVNVFGTECKVHLLFTPEGKFVQRFTGFYSTATGFDGTLRWNVDYSGTPYVFDAYKHNLDRFKLDTWMQTGLWLGDEGSTRISVVDDQTDDHRVVLSVSLQGIELEYWMVIDRSTWLPKAYCEVDQLDSPRFRLEDYRLIMGFRYPYRAVYREANKPEAVFQVRSIVATPSSQSNPYTLTANWLPDTRFDANSPPSVPLIVTKSGHLIVRTRINGQDAGWFVIDTGTNVLLINTKTANSLDLPTVLTGDGAVGLKKISMTLRQCRKFTLGPLTMSDTIWVQLDLSELSKHAGIEISGIIGYDLFCRAIVELDISNTALDIHNPNTYSNKNLEWEEFVYNDRLVCVRCQFEGDHDALFLIDTGSDSAIQFEAPAIEKFELFDKFKKIPPWQQDIPGTWFSKTKSAKGRLGWFEVAGHRLQSLEAVFNTPKSNDESFDEHKWSGLIGLGVLDRFKLVFDYPNKRIAFVYKEPARQSER